MENYWKKLPFEISTYMDLQKYENLGAVYVEIEDSKTTLKKMKTSKHAAYFIKHIESFENSLNEIMDLVEQIDLFQVKFFSLKNILSKNFMKKNFPDNIAMFEDIVNDWKITSEIIVKEKLYWNVCQQSGFSSKLFDLNELIQNLLKSLKDYLELIRSKFPRLYFVSDDDILSILGYLHPKNVQVYLKLIFDGIHCLKITEVIEKQLIEQRITWHAVAMCSEYEEQVNFINSVHLHEVTEMWLKDIENMMQLSLCTVLPKCLKALLTILGIDLNFTDSKWLDNWPYQVSDICIQIAWTAEVTSSIKSVQESAQILPLKNLRKRWKEILLQFVKKLSEKSTVLMQMNCMVMILSIAHFCEIIEYLIKCVCNDTNAFEWIMQIRYYYDEENETCFIKQAKTVITYGFEYIGKRECLIITPLTERCFFGITAAMFLCKGVFMQGTKSSGKTETVKELGKAFGKYVVLVNCCQNFNKTSLICATSAIAQIGAWGVFEEFDTVNVEIISVISQIFSAIFSSISSNEETFSYMGREVPLMDSCSIFLTINSDSLRSYELPSALLDSFRPVTMISPDIQMIIEVNLFAFGFKESKIFAENINQFLKFADDQLCHPYHYDFGLCTVTSFLKCVNILKQSMTEASETEIILTALKHVLLPKLIPSDIQLFEILLDSVFGSVKMLDKDISFFQKCMEDVKSKYLFQEINSVLDKCLKFHELRNFYHCIILLGKSGSGKTTTWNFLRDIYSSKENPDFKSAEDQAIEIYTCHPKAYSLQELYGHYTDEGVWNNGLFSSLLLDACNNARAVQSWIILNGPIDFEWIGNISSLLDSKKLYTVANGERIDKILLSDKVTMIIETTSLSFCSPSSITHCGMIYYDESNTNWNMYFTSWLQKVIPEFVRNVIKDLGLKFLESIFEFSKDYLEDSKDVVTSQMNTVTSFCRLMDIFINQISNADNMAQQISRCFWMSVIWSVGSTVNAKGQYLFDEFVHSVDDTLPSGFVYDYRLNEKLEWECLSNVIQCFGKADIRTSLEKILVPNKKMLSYQFVIETCLKNKISVLLNGVRDCGKTATAEYALTKLNPETFIYSTYNISSQITSSKFQQSIESLMIKKAGNVCVPKDKTYLVSFMDDLNLARIDKFSSVSLQELILALLTNEFWYDRRTWKKNHLKVIRKIVDVKPNIFHNRLTITKLWFHECIHQLCDKFMSKEDRESFLDTLRDIIEDEFLLESINEFPEPIFIKFLDPVKYHEVESLNILIEYFKTPVQDYNSENSHLSPSIIIFPDFAKHLHRIIRGMEIPYGNILLIGASGTGKHTLCKLSAFILNYQVFELQVEEPSEELWIQSLQEIIYLTGVQKKNVAFLLSDNQLQDDTFLQNLCELLNTGEVADLFNKSELEKMYAEMKKSSDTDIDTESYRDLLANSVKRHLHVLLCLSYGTSFYKKCFSNSCNLVKYVTIDWFEDWPKEALKSISLTCISDVDIDQSEEKRITCCDILPEIHETVLKSNEKYHVFTEFDSTSFFHLVNSFKSVLDKRTKKVHSALERLNLGLVKINETEEKVNEIAKETLDARNKLIIAEEECDIALIDIQDKKTIVAEKKETIEEKKIEIERKGRVCKRIAIAAQEDLNAALPALEEARKALEALNKKDVGEIKSYASPPALVEMVLEAVLLLRRCPQPSWAEAKRQLVEKYVQRPEFQPDIVGRVSVAAKSLCMWVRAMHLYGEIYKKVKPKKERLRLAQEELDALEITLSNLLNELEKLEATISELEEQHQLLIKKKEEYSRNAEILALKLERANKIMESLKSEKERWENKISDLTESRKYVVGDSFIAAGYLAYLGPCDSHFRTLVCKTWQKKIEIRNFPCNPAFDLSDFFIDEQTLAEWNSQGLPNDQYSRENASILIESTYQPYIIDPEEQAKKWLKNMGLKQGLIILDFQNSEWISILESAIINGYPVLLEDIKGHWKPTIESLLQRKHQSIVIFNEKQLNVHPSFSLYLVTKSSYSQLFKVVIKSMCIINFTIKEKGLEDQLLPLIVEHEKNELEAKKEELVNIITESRNQLLELENKILNLLNESQGSLIDNEYLVNSLNETKSVSTKVEERLLSSQKEEISVDSAREKYRPAAKSASILYFALSDLASVEPIYIFTLDSYVNLFLNSIKNSPRDSEVRRRVKKLNLFHQYHVYRWACRTISEKHSLLLAFQICCRVLSGEGSLDKDEYDFFIKGGKNVDRSAQLPNPCSQWLPQECWDNITQLERLPKFIGLTVSFDEISKDWQNWYHSPEPEKVSLPGHWRNVCSEFEKLLIIRSLRIDRISSCVRIFILNHLDKRFLDYPHTNLKEIIKESIPKMPIILLSLSSDKDSQAIISELAKDFGTANGYQSLSLNLGKGQHAEKLITESAKQGHWVLIFNCHLLPTWMSVLEKIVDDLKNKEPHPEFRLFLSSKRSGIFPPSVLKNSNVVTLDDPKGVRANMLKIYNSLSLNEEKKQCTNDVKYKSLLFSLSFFHSILLERKKFQNLGWHSDYHFTSTEFETSRKMLELYLSEYKEVSWDALRKNIAEFCYCNHMIDEMDMRLLLVYFEQYFCDEVYATIKYPLSSLEQYYIPEYGAMESYIKYILNLPTVDEAEVFGQHPNSEIPYTIQEGQSLLSYLSKIEDGTCATKIENEEHRINLLLQELKQNIPDCISEESVLNILQEKQDLFSIILLQETKEYNILIKLVKNSLNELEECMNGKRKMADKYKKLMECVLNMQVPTEWKKVYPSMKSLGSWMQDFKLRIKQFKDWSSSGNPPIKFWLPGFISPKRILNATLITTAKRNDVLLKDLVWEHHVSTLDEAHIKESPPEGIYVNGLILEGAGWDKTNCILVDPDPLRMTTLMPIIHFKPVTESSMRGLYSCPCYYTSTKIYQNGNSSHLFNLDLKTKKPKEYWIKRGTSIIMSSKD